MFSKKLAALVAASLVVATSPALAQSAAPAPVRASVDSTGDSQLGGGSGGLWAGVIGIALLAAFVLVVLDDDNDDAPVSP